MNVFRPVDQVATAVGTPSNSTQTHLLFVYLWTFAGSMFSVFVCFLQTRVCMLLLSRLVVFFMCYIKTFDVSISMYHVFFSFYTATSCYTMCRRREKYEQVRVQEPGSQANQCRSLRSYFAFLLGVQDAPWHRGYPRRQRLCRGCRLWLCLQVHFWK